MASWFSKHFGVRLDSHSLGNLVKNASPALAFTPAGFLGAALTSVAGDALRGKKDIGGVLRGALTNASLGTGAHALTGRAGLLSQ